MSDIKRETGDYIHRQKALAKIKKDGMYIPAKVEIPSEFLTKEGTLYIPYDLTESTTEDLGRYLTIFTQLSAYYDVVVALADIDLTTAERVKDYTEALTLIEIGKDKKGGTLTEKKAERSCVKTVIQAQDWYDQQKSIYELSNAILKGCEKLVFMLSREITRRGSSQKMEYRDFNVHKHLQEQTNLISGGEENGDD